MNLLAKIRIYGALILGLIIFNSCEEKGDFGLGSDDVAPIEFQSEKISLNTSVVWLDSIRSNNLGRMLVGEHSGSEFGEISSTGYIGIDLNESRHPSLDEEAVFDSARINFTLNSLYDTSANNRELNIRAYPIIEEFKDTTYITRNSLQRSNQLIASRDIQVEKLDSVYAIHVDQAWASQIFEGIRSGDATFDSQSAFDAFFRGFALTHEGSSQNVFGIVPGASFELVLYYSVPLDDGSGGFSNRRIEMSSTGRPSFHNLTVDRSATDFSVVQQTNIEYPTVPRLVVQSGAGIVTRLDLSDLERFTNQNQGAIINLSEITIGPINDLQEGVPPPPSLFLFITDERNTVIRDGTVFRAIQRDGERISVLARDTPLQLIFDPDTRTYSGSMTKFTQAYFSDVFRRNEIFLYPSNMNLGASGFSVNTSNLNIKIFYSQLK